jgi:hypothetical protein
MSLLELNLCDLRPNDDRQAGKLAESSRGVDLSNKRSGKLHSSGMYGYRIRRDLKDQDI